MARGEVKYRLVLDSKEYTDAIARAKRANEDFAKSLGSTFDPITGKNYGQQLTSSLGQVKAAMPAVLGAFAAATAAAVTFGKAISETAKYADNLGELAARTGIAAENLQHLEYAAKLTGTSLENVASAINKMQKAMTENPKLFEKMGFDLKAIRDMSPEQQFSHIARGLETIADPAARAAAQMAVFGKSGNELRALTKELDGLTEASRKLGGALSQGQIERMGALADSTDALGIAWKRLKDQVSVAFGGSAASSMNALANAVGYFAEKIKQNEALFAGFARFIAGVATFGMSEAFGNVGRYAGGGGGGRPEQIPGLGVVAAWHAGQGPRITYDPAGDAVKKQIQDALAKLRAEWTQALKELAKTWTYTMDDVDQELANLWKNVEAADKKLQQRLAMGRAFMAPGFVGGLYSGASPHVPTPPGFVSDEMRDYMHSLGTMPLGQGGLWTSYKDVRDQENANRATISWQQNLQNLTSTLTALGGATTGFGRALVVVAQGLAAAQQVLNLIKSSGGWSRLTSGEKFGVGVQGLGVLAGAYQGGSFLGGAASGAAFGSAFGPIGMGVGAVVGGLAGLLGGRGKEHRQVNDMRDEFLASMGGWQEFQRMLAQAGDKSDLLKKIFDAKTVTQFNAAVAEAQKLLKGYQDQVALQTEAQQALEEAIQRYGFSIEELGPKFKQQKLDEMAAQLIQDYRLLTASGIEQNTVISKMGPALNEYVQTAIAAGGAIPEAMKPIIEALIAQGLLLDANGNAYKSAEDAGITYSQTMSEMFESLIEKIDRLVSALLGIPPNVRTTVTVDTEYEGDEDDGGKGRRGRGDRDDIPGHARGGDFEPREGGHVIRVAEGGEREFVRTESQMQAIVSGAVATGAATAQASFVPQVVAAVTQAVQAGLATQPQAVQIINQPTIAPQIDPKGIKRNHDDFMADVGDSIAEGVRLGNSPLIRALEQRYGDRLTGRR